MVKIVHYEVYVDLGSGWQLKERFYSGQRDEAFALAREQEASKTGVRVCKEIFDVQDNTVQEVIEYARNFKDAPKSKVRPVSYEGERPNSASAQLASPSNKKQTTEEPALNSKILSALLKIFFIIIICLIFTNILLKLIIPLVQLFVSEDITKALYFVLFFAIFLALAVPLMLKKIPWHIFVDSQKAKVKEEADVKYYQKAENIIKQYNLNDEYIYAIAPVFPDAELQYKKYIVLFLKRLFSSLSTMIQLDDSFNRLGVKLIVYGGCLELSRQNGLKITEANSLLQEAFNIIDGKIASLEDFYEAKKTYKDNKIAIFLTGVGAYLMAQELQGLYTESDILLKGFARWKEMNQIVIKDNTYAEEFAPDDTDVNGLPNRMLSSIDSGMEQPYPNTVYLYNKVQFLDLSEVENEKKVKNTVKNIIINLSSRLGGEGLSENGNVVALKFGTLGAGMRFAKDVVADIGALKDSLHNETFSIYVKCCVLPQNQTDSNDLNAYVNDVFMHAYNNDIIITQPIKTRLSQRYPVDVVGEKMLPGINQNVVLYKLIK